MRTRRTHYHRVDGIGKQRGPDTDIPFNPESYERAIHGLQQLIMDVGRLEHKTAPDGITPDEYAPEHEHGEENGEKYIEIEEDTMLHSVCRIIPEKWDVSILNDTVIESGYAVRASVDCGGEVLVTATLYVQDGMLRKLDISHTSMEDRNDQVGITDIGIHEPSRVLTHINRYLERTVIQAYAATIGSAATAFDYIGTKRDIPPTGKRRNVTRTRYESVNQQDWATIRDKTPQTVSDNVRKARDQLRELGRSPFQKTEPALTEESPFDIALR